MTWRLVAAMVTVVLLALVIQDVPLAGYLRDVERDRIVTSLERDAFVLAGRSGEALHSATPDADGAISSLARNYRDAGGARVVIVDGAGTAIVTSDDDEVAVGSSYLTRPEIADALAGRVVDGTRFSTTLNEELLYVAVPVLSGSDILGAVRLTYPAATVSDAVNQKISVFGLVGLTTVLLAGVIGLLLSRSVTRRLRLLRDVTERFADGDRSARAEESSGAPELRSLAGSFNAMALRLDTVIDQQRAFAGDASHQLRTPLTALRLRIERARELAPTDSRAAVTRLESAEAELDRLETLIEGLLVLSRAEGGTATVGRVDVAAIARDRIEQWAAFAAESGRTVTGDVASGEADALAVPTAVEQILDNLIDNALSVTAEGGSVLVRVGHEHDRTSIHVLDRGPGLTEEQRGRAFERFWRGDSDRPGSGLGLAIVAQLAGASGATVELEPRDGGGVDAVVRFSRLRSRPPAPSSGE